MALAAHGPARTLGGRTDPLARNGQAQPPRGSQSQSQSGQTLARAYRDSGNDVDDSDNDFVELEAEPATVQSFLPPQGRRAAQSSSQRRDAGQFVPGGMRGSDQAPSLASRPRFHVADGLRVRNA
eukprot:1387633-Rhodomonas_salina.1